MKILIRNAKSKEGKPYLALVAKTEYGETFITFKKDVIAMIIPKNMHIAYIPEGDTIIGEIYEQRN